MSVRIKTGIKKDASFDQNLKAVREACACYGVETVIDRLREMKSVFYWIKSDETWQGWIDDLINQVEFDHYVLPKLIEEVEITEFTQGPDGSFGTKKRKVKIVIDPMKGEPTHDFIQGVIY